MMGLLTKEDFAKSIKFEEDNIKKYWNKELYACPRCGEGVKRDYSVAYMTNPPKYRYFCKNCSYTEIF